MLPTRMSMQTIATDLNRSRLLQCAGHYGARQSRIDVADELPREEQEGTVNGGNAERSEPSPGRCSVRVRHFRTVRDNAIVSGRRRKGRRSLTA